MLQNEDIGRTLLTLPLSVLVTAAPFSKYGQDASSEIRDIIVRVCHHSKFFVQCDFLFVSLFMPPLRIIIYAYGALGISFPSHLPLDIISRLNTLVL